MSKLLNAAREDSEDSLHPPAVARADDGAIEQTSLVSVIEWFLRNDPRVAIINHPRVEEVFQWKQSQSRATERQTESSGVEASNDYTSTEHNHAPLQFARAEDRLAIGIFQAVAEHDTEQALHAWIGELLVAIDESKQMNEEISISYKLDAEASPVGEAAKIPTAQERDFYLSSCWLEALCTAEARVLGWVYQSFYARPFHPNNFQ